MATLQNLQDLEMKVETRLREVLDEIAGDGAGSVKKQVQALFENNLQQYQDVINKLVPEMINTNIKNYQDTITDQLQQLQ